MALRPIEFLLNIIYSPFTTLDKLVNLLIYLWNSNKQSIDKLVLFRPIIEQRIHRIIQKRSNGICSSNNRTQFDQKRRQSIVLRFDLNDQSVDIVVEVKGGHVVYLEGIVIVGILVRPSLSKEMVRVYSRDYIEMVMANVRMGSPSHIVHHLVVLQFRKDGFRMLLLDSADVVHIPKEKIPDLV